MKTAKTYLIIATVTLVLVFALAAGGCTTPSAPETPATTPTPSETATPPDEVQMPQFLRIVGISGSGGYYDEQHMTLAELMRTEYPDMAVRTLPGSSEEIVRQMEGGENDISVTIDSYILDCQESKGKFAEDAPFTKLRTLGGWSLGDTSSVMAVRGDSDIEKMCDLLGKRIGVGAKGGMTGVYFEEGLKHFCGFGYEDIEKAGGLVYYGDMTEARDMLAAGELDAAMANKHPDAQLQLLQSKRGMRILTFSEEEWQWIAQAMRGVTYYCVPAGVYEDAPSFCGGATSMTFIVSADLPEDAVYNLAKTIYSDDGIQFFLDRCGTFKALTIDAVRDQGIMRLKNPPAPIHPGATKYWKEQGQL